MGIFFHSTTKCKTKKRKEEQLAIRIIYIKFRLDFIRENPSENYLNAKWI